MRTSFVCLQLTYELIKTGSKFIAQYDTKVKGVYCISFYFTSDQPIHGRMEITTSAFVSKVCDELARVRIEANMTPEYAYSKTQINVSRIEKGEQDITLATLKRLCECYNISLKEFFERLE